MPAIAAEAGVVVETIYRAFGSKAGLFKAVIEAALAGGSETGRAPPAERPAIRAVIEETDPRRKLELYAATQPGVHGRSGPLYRVLVGCRRQATLNCGRYWTVSRRVGCMAWRPSPASSRRAELCVPICRSSRPETSSGHSAPRLCMTYSFVNVAGPVRPTETGLRVLCSASCSRRAVIPSRTDTRSP